MKKGTKIGVGAALLLLGVTAVTSCTQSFCTTTDSARIMYAFDPGITRYQVGTDTFSITDNGRTYTLNNYQADVATWDNELGGFKWVDGTEDKPLTYLNSIISSSKSSGYITVNEKSKPYFAAIDQEVFKAILKTAVHYSESNITRDLSKEEDLALFNRDVAKYSYIKYVTGDGETLWETYDQYDKTVRLTVSADVCPSSDFLALYKSKVTSYANTYRTCLTTKEDKYGSYGYEADGVYISEKTWGFAWSKGFFEGLLVYPIGWLIDQIVGGFRAANVAPGAAALLGIIFVTLIIRSLMLLATIKQTVGNAKMTELQPEIQKIQNKYPNANTSQVEKQRMAEEMNRLYKKNKINPFTTIIVLIVQFPVFICVWGALSGASAITNGSILGLSLASSIKDVLFVASNWTAAGNYSAVTAFFLFLLMAGAQTVAMLLPQWMQKKKAKNVSKLGTNPAQKQQNNTMKIFTYVMLAMIIFMGFSLVSAMGIYWTVGAVFSVGQTLITQAITGKAKKKQ